MCFIHLKTVPNSTPIKIAWVDKISLRISENCKVAPQLGAYSEKIWCNVLPIDVVHILLCRPWLYDKNATNRGKDNTYKIRLAPT